MSAFMQDVRDACRRLIHAQTFTLTAVAVLALGIGVNTAIFSLVNAVLFRPLPVQEPEKLVYGYQVRDGVYTGLSAETYAAITGLNLFTNVSTSSIDFAMLQVGNEVEQVRGSSVTASYFDVLGITPAMGRAFLPTDGASAPPVLVISHDLWQRRFHADAGIIGQTVMLRPGIRGLTVEPGRLYTVIGVTAAEFRGTGSPWEATEYWVPLAQRAVDYACDDPEFARHTLMTLIGRLRRDVPFERAAAAVASWGLRERADSARPSGRSASELSTVLLDSRRTRLPFDPTYKIVPARLATALVIMSGIVLVIAAANLVGLLMARGVTRRHETAIRLTLGASRGRVARQWLIESLLLAAAGGVAGVVAARALVRLFLTTLPTEFGTAYVSHISLDVPLDLRVLTFTALVCVAAALLVGIGPARQASKTDLLASLAGSSASAPRVNRARVRHWILVPQVGLSMVLLLVSSALVRTLLKSEMADPGYAPDGVVSAEFQVAGLPHCLQSRAGLSALRDERQAFEGRVLDAVTRRSTVTAVALTDALPTGADRLVGAVITREGYAARAEHRWVNRADVSAGYFSTMGIPIVRGRGFEALDMHGGPPVVVVSRALGEALWPGIDPLGQHLAVHHPSDPPPSQWAEVVGVVNDTVPALTDGAPNPTVYLPAGHGAYASRVVARGAGTTADTIEAVRAALNEADGSVNVVRVRPLTAEIAQLRYSRRLAVAILASAGTVAMLLAAIGLYGVIAHSVTQRVRELGIRAALGADGRDLILLVLREAATVTVIGVAIGLASTFSAIGLVSRMVVAIPSIDLLTLTIVVAVLGMAILLACYLPARRAGAVDPMVVLRSL